MELMPVIPIAVENLPNSSAAEASAKSGTGGEFESWMAEFVNIQNPEEPQKDISLPFAAFQGSCDKKALPAPEAALLFPTDDVDTLLPGDEAIGSALLSSVFQGEVMNLSPETGSELKVPRGEFPVIPENVTQGERPILPENVTQGERPILPENRTGVPLTTVVQEEASVLEDLLSQQIQPNNVHSGAASADKLSNNPAVLVPGADYSLLQEKGMKNYLIPNSNINVDKNLGEQDESSQELLKVSDEAVLVKAPLRQAIAGKGRLPEALAEGSLSMSSGMFKPKLEKLGEGIQSQSASSTSEFSLSETAKGIVAQHPAQMDAYLTDVNSAGLSSHADPSGGVETAGKEFVNIREGVELYRLPSGELIDKSSVLDQVIHHVSLRNAQEGKTLTVRMHPQELGDLKLDLILENDRVRVNIQAQTNMVRDVLEQHLPRLRDALEAQGVRVGEMQLSLDSQQQNGFESFRNFSSGQDGLQQQFHNVSQVGDGDEHRVTEIPPEELLSNTQNAAQGGLSVRI